MRRALSKLNRLWGKTFLKMEEGGLLAFCQRTIALEDHSNGLFLHGVKEYVSLVDIAVCSNFKRSHCHHMYEAFCRVYPMAAVHIDVYIL